MGTSDHAESLLPMLQKLRSLICGGNPWERPPSAVVAAGKDSICGYYDELKRCATDPVKMQSLKVVFAGHSGAGKTRYAIFLKATLEGMPAQLSRGSVVVFSAPRYNMVSPRTKLPDNQILGGAPPEYCALRILSSYNHPFGDTNLCIEILYLSNYALSL